MMQVDHSELRAALERGDVDQVMRYAHARGAAARAQESREMLAALSRMVRGLFHKPANAGHAKA